MVLRSIECCSFSSMKRDMFLLLKWLSCSLMRLDARWEETNSGLKLGLSINTNWATSEATRPSATNCGEPKA